MICQAKSHSCIISASEWMHAKTRQNNVPDEDPTLGENYCTSFSVVLLLFSFVRSRMPGIERSFSVFMTSTLPVLRVQRQHARKIFSRLCRRSGWTGKFFPMQLHTLSATEQTYDHQKLSSVSNGVTTHNTTMLRAASSKLVKAGLSRGSQG